MSDQAPKPVMLIVMDGWGLREETDHNAVRLAKTPVVDRLSAEWPYATLKTSGGDVGLPAGQMGNSEVGHLNLGAGRVVWQDISRIDNSIEEGDFFENEALVSAIDHAKSNDTRLHLLGLISDGGVHSSDRHVAALLDMCARRGLRGDRVALHAFMDGRDTPPHGGKGYLKAVEDQMASTGAGVIATVIGRYHVMDRDKRWPRIEKGYRAMVDGTGESAESAAAAIQASYDNDVTDEFVEPVVIRKSDGEPLARIRPNDAVIFFNFRADRARQISHALLDEEFPHFDRADGPLDLKYVTMTHYEDSMVLPEAYPPEKLDGLLTDIVSAAGKSQLRTAETEKYPHVTFFFNGGEDAPRPNEDHRMEQSPKVATYDLQPEMSAPGLTAGALDAIRSAKYDLVILNYANGDMVGHTGVLEAAIKAVETVDDGVRQIVDAILDVGGAVFITADHGNCEQMWDPKTDGPHTAHTTNPVPCILVGKGLENAKLRQGGRLADVAPTLLDLMGLDLSPQMTGESLIASRG